VGLSLRVASAIVGIAFAMVGISITIERRVRVVGFLGKIVASCILLVVAYVLFIFGMGAAAVLPFVAGALLAAEARRTTRAAVRHRYWNTQDGHP
jgi:hypothetical protein